MRLIPAGNASAWTGPTGNNTYLLLASPSVLIDAGVGAPSHIETLVGALGGAPLDTVLITHGHEDHAGGIPALRAHWPDLSIRGQAGTPLRDDERLVYGGTCLRAVHTPGHSPDHFCFFDETTRDLYCGDLARMGGTIVIPASRGGDLGEYLASLRRVRELQPARMLPAHGPAIEDPARLLDAYLAHRAERQEQVEQAVAEGVREVDAIVARLYPALSGRLREAACETVRAHLRYLADPR